MKSNLKKLLALLFAALIALSLTSLSEEEVIFEDDSVTIDETSDDILFPDEADLATQLEELELSIPDIGLESPEGEGTIASEAITESETTSNALVKKVVIGVKEKYTIGTSSLKGKLTFTSAKPAIATVTKKGVIVGKKAGTTKIVITVSNKKKYNITVVVAKAPSKVRLSKTKATLKIGDTLRLKAVLPKKTASNKMTWTSSNKSIATVSKTGVVTARAAGTANITVKTFNGKKATCKVTVTEPEPVVTPTPEPTPEPTMVTVDRTDVVLNVGETGTVKVTFYGNASVSYSVRETGIVKCEWSRQWDNNTTDLYLTGIDGGSTVVTLYDDAAGFSVSINVTVIGSAPTPAPTQQPGYTGEILGAYGTDIDVFRDALDDYLPYYKYDYDAGNYIYANDYMMVYASATTNKINTISLYNNTSGKYTLSNLYPGMGFYTAQSKAESIGWTYFGDKNDSYFYRAKYNGESLVLVITKMPGYSLVQSVTIMPA